MWHIVYICNSHSSIQCTLNFYGLLPTWQLKLETCMCVRLFRSHSAMLHYRYFIEIDVLSAWVERSPLFSFLLRERVCARVNLCCVLLFSEITFPLEITIHRQQIIKFNLHLNVSYWCLTTMRWEEQHFVFAGTHKKICKLKFERWSINKQIFYWNNYRFTIVWCSGLNGWFFSFLCWKFLYMHINKHIFDTNTTIRWGVHIIHLGCREDISGPYFAEALHLSLASFLPSVRGLGLG